MFAPKQKATQVEAKPKCSCAGSCGNCSRASHTHRSLGETVSSRGTSSERPVAGSPFGYGVDRGGGLPSVARAEPQSGASFRFSANAGFRGDPAIGTFGKDAGAGDAGAPASGLGAATPAVTWTGLDFDAKATYTPCTDCKDGLEAVQVAWGAGGPSHVGKAKATFAPLLQIYDTFVDGGVNSPGGATYNADHPYYIGRSDLPASYGYKPAQGSAGSVSGCTVNPTDRPTAATVFKEAYFETVMVCLNYQGTGKDKLMNAVQWGFTDFGKTHRVSPTDPATAASVTSSPSSDFENTLKADYPSYSHV